MSFMLQIFRVLLDLFPSLQEMVTSLGIPLPRPTELQITFQSVQQLYIKFMMDINSMRIGVLLIHEKTELFTMNMSYFDE